MKLNSETVPARVEYELETGPFARIGKMVVPIGKAAPRTKRG